MMNEIKEKLPTNGMLQYLLSKWSTNETLLQYYRTIFIASQSIIIAMGAILVGKSFIVFLPILGIGVVIIWFIWFPIVEARQKIVDYYKYSLLLGDEERAKLCSEDEYVTCESKRNKINSEIFETENRRKTRKKIDLILPILFTVIWGILLIYFICENIEKIICFVKLLLTNECN